MSIDNQLREAEREMKESPGDADAIKKWMNLNVKAGAETKCRWKIKQDGKYLSKDSYNRYLWAEKGSSFTTKDKAIKYLIAASRSNAHWAYNHQGSKNTSNAEIVIHRTYTTEEVVEVNLETYQKEAEIEKLNSKRKKLEAEAKELARKMAIQQAELERKTKALEKRAKELEAEDVD